MAALNEIDEHQDSTASIVGGQAEIIDGLDARIGALTDLNTTAKGTIVAAINEVKTSADGKMTSAQVDSKITAAKAGLATEAYVSLLPLYLYTLDTLLFTYVSVASPALDSAIFVSTVAFV